MKERITTAIASSLAAAFIVCFIMLVEYGLFIFTGSIIAVTAILAAMLTCYLIFYSN